MSKKSTDNFYKTVMTLIKRIDFSKMSGASIFNLLSGTIIAIVMVVLSITPVLSLVERILVSVGNIFVSIFSDNALLAAQSPNASVDILIAALILVVEMAICKWFCTKAASN